MPSTAARRFVVSLGVALALGAGPARAAPPDTAALDGVRQGRLLLRLGSSGPAVRALQRALTAAGAAVTDTGVFGQRTLAAVRAFQRDHGCKVDGLVGRETVGALDRALGAPPARTLRRLTDREVTPAITAAAVRILRAHRGEPYGFEVPFTADGAEYVGRIERHYHPPGGALRPWGEHPGVSVFAVVAPPAP